MGARSSSAAILAEKHGSSRAVPHSGKPDRSSRGTWRSDRGHPAVKNKDSRPLYLSPVSVFPCPKTTHSLPACQETVPDTFSSPSPGSEFPLYFANV
jgi:hypothetical protein